MVFWRDSDCLVKAKVSNTVLRCFDGFVFQQNWSLEGLVQNQGSLTFGLLNSRYAKSMKTMVLPVHLGPTTDGLFLFRRLGQRRSPGANLE